MDAADDSIDATDLPPVRAAAERFSAGGETERALRRRAVVRALPIVLATFLGGLVLATLAAITGVLALGVAPIVVGLAAAIAAVVALVKLGEAEARREAASRGVRERAAGDLMAAVGGALAHVERLDAERIALNRKVAKLERRIAGKDRRLARLQAFDAERRTLEPAPPEQPQAEQLTLEAVLAAQDAESTAGEQPAAPDA